MNKIRDGYKMTELGEIPSEWKVKTIDDICYLNPDTLSNKTKENLLIEYIDIESVTPRKINGTKIFEFKDAPSRARRVVKKNDIIMSTVRPYLKAFAKINIDRENLVCSTGFAVLRVKENVNHEFVFQTILSDYYIQQLSNKMVGSNYPAVNTSDVKESFIILPPIEEQEKIASILSTVDEQIDNVDGLIEKNKELKKGLMQQLLTKGIGHTKFKKTEVGEIPEHWEVKKLKDLGNSIIGLTYSPDDLVEAGEGTLVLRSSNIKNSRIVFDDNKYVKTNIQDKLIVKEDDILICSRNGSKDLIGKCALIDKKTEGSSFGAFMTIYRSDYNKYLFNVFTSYMFKRQIYNNLGATINQITTDNLNNFKVILPPINEQEEIASILLKVDEKIDEYVNKKEKLEELKKGLMQQLLTGNIRVY
ncbi:restriction endonuclease subunit S [Clostridium sp. SGI.024]|uniref:restriction endonuclease subunit S n=1 Tax=Clostridium sp. SGI.024 TaxID=3420551 RepID=UPI003D0545FB